MKTKIYKRSLFASLKIENNIENQSDNQITFSFASNVPIERPFEGVSYGKAFEVLSHERNAVDLTRLNDGANLLFNHDPDKYLGKVVKAWHDSERSYCTVELSAESSFAKDKIPDVKNGTLRNVSVGYHASYRVEYSRNHGINIADPNAIKQAQNDYITMIAEEWTPYEVSIVTVPADASVGIGRSDEDKNLNEVLKQFIDKQNQEPKEEVTKMPDVKIEENKIDPAQIESERRDMIDSYCESFQIDKTVRQNFIKNHRTLDDTRTAILEFMKTRQAPNDSTFAPEPADHKPQLGEKIGLTTDELKSYSLARAIHANNRENWKQAGFERSVSEALAKEVGRDPRENSFFIPLDLPLNPKGLGRRDLDASISAMTKNQGYAGELIATTMMPTLIDYLYNKTRVLEMGATMMTGLQGNISIPRQTEAGEAQFTAEGQDAIGGTLKFDSIQFSPKTLTAYRVWSKQMQLQSSFSVEALLRKNLLNAFAQAIDKNALYGNPKVDPLVPQGILTHKECLEYEVPDGVLDFDAFIDIQTLLNENNIIADESEGKYLTSYPVRSMLRKLKASGSGEYYVASAMDEMGIPQGINWNAIYGSNNLKPDADGKHTLIYGDWSQFLMCQWGVLEINTNDRGLTFRSNGIEVVAMMMLDMGIMRPESFVIVDNITTTSKIAKKVA